MLRSATAGCLQFLLLAYAHVPCKAVGKRCTTEDATSLIQTFAKSTVRTEALETQPNTYSSDLPRFETPAELHLPENSKWLEYLKKLYGPMVFEKIAYPIDVSKFWVLNHKHLVSAGLAEESDIELVRIQHEAPHEGSPDRSLVEIVHCTSDKVNHRQMHYAPGSGSFYSLGKTKVFHEHRDAVAEFLPGSKCADATCEELLEALIAKAAQNYTSLQFLGHSAQKCPGGHGYEILDLHHDREEICSLPMSGGFGYCACSCNERNANKNQPLEQLGCKLDCSSPPASASKESNYLLSLEGLHAEFASRAAVGQLHELHGDDPPDNWWCFAVPCAMLPDKWYCKLAEWNNGWKEPLKGPYGSAFPYWKHYMKWKKDGGKKQAEECKKTSEDAQKEKDEQWKKIEGEPWPWWWS